MVATKDWAAEAAKVTSLEVLTSLAEEASTLGEMGVRVGEGTVFDILRSRKVALESPPLTEDAGTPGKDRNWVGEVRALSSRAEAHALIQEATAAGALPSRITAMTTAAEALPEAVTAPEAPEGGWATADIPKDAEWKGDAAPEAGEEVPFG